MPRFKIILLFAIIGMSLAILSPPQRPTSISPQKVYTLPTLKTEGGMLQAFLLAHDALMCEPNVSPAQKEIRNNSVEIVQGSLFYSVKFKTQQGEIDYWINKVSGRLTRAK